ncbi:hypothetical protein [Absidia glauca]|uniref:BZIP domain-containing protein n=1 Tax=Absidia glauca TaxID=4829 RepID=A0A163JRM9_ABSGL|nr:hypothetical protein [Absidia glauca]
MTDYFYNSYISPLDALAFDIAQSPSETEQETAAAELALWSNAQFTFDVKPGQGIYDDEKLSGSTNAIKKKAEDNDPITYEKLVNYLDYELPQQQQQQKQQQPRPSPLLQQHPLAPAPPSPALLSPTYLPTTGGRQLLPKPTMMDPLQLASLLTTPLAHLAHPAPMASPPPAKKQRKKSPSPAATASVVKREEDVDDEATLAEEDKRKRNTAASARFRIKKKLREQAMEQTVRDMTKKSDFLQGRVNDLELEVKWLRSLLTEKDLTVKNNA